MFLHFIKKTIAIFLIAILLLSESQFSLAAPYPSTLASRVSLPSPIIEAAPILKGIIIDPNSSLEFNFIMDPGSQKDQQALKKESEKLISYFLAALTIPEKDLWVNLSPYEKDRIIPDILSETQLGRDLLSQDYILKKLSSSFTNPDTESGKKFWQKLREKVYEQLKIQDVPLEVFNKIWIIPDTAKIYENENKAFVVYSHLKVLTEDDYLALKEQTDSSTINLKEKSQIAKISASVLKEIIIPEIEREVNSGKDFAIIRQVYQSFILAVWYKDKLKESILAKEYFNKNKTTGIDVVDETLKENLYKKYLEAFKNGAYSFIKEDYDPQSQNVLVRKYFSGGVLLLPKEPYQSSAALASEQIQSRGYVELHASGISSPSAATVANQGILERHMWGFVRSIDQVPDEDIKGKVLEIREDLNTDHNSPRNHPRLKAVVPMLKRLSKAGGIIFIRAHRGDPSNEVKEAFEKELKPLRDEIKRLRKQKRTLYKQIEEGTMPLPEGLASVPNRKAMEKSKEIQEIAQIKAINDDIKAREEKLKGLVDNKKQRFIELQDAVFPALSLEETAAALEELLGQKVYFTKALTIGQARKEIPALKEGDIVLFENVRFNKDETVLQKAKELLKTETAQVLKKKKVVIIEKLGAENYSRLEDIINGILGDFQLTGEKLTIARRLLKKIISDPQMFSKLELAYLSDPKTVLADDMKAFLKALTPESKRDSEEILRIFNDIDNLIVQLEEPLKAHLNLQSKYTEGADLFIEDAAGVAHREHASVTARIAVASFMGSLMMEEMGKAIVKIVSGLTTPCISGKSPKSLNEKMGLVAGFLRIPTVENMPIGGQPAIAYLKALNQLDPERAQAVKNMRLNVPSGKKENEFIKAARAILEVDDFRSRILLPEDLLVGRNLDDPEKAEFKVVGVDEPLEKEWKFLDVGPKTMLKHYQLILDGKVVFYNGPLGRNRRDRAGVYNQVTGSDRLDTLIAALDESQREAFKKLILTGVNPVNEADLNRMIVKGELGTYVELKALQLSAEKGNVAAIGGGGTTGNAQKFGFSNFYTYVLTSGGSALSTMSGKASPGYESLLNNIPATIDDYLLVDQYMQNSGESAKGTFAALVQRGLSEKIVELRKLMIEILGEKKTDEKLAEVMKVIKQLEQLDELMPFGRRFFKAKEEALAQRAFDQVVNIIFESGINFEEVFRGSSITGDEIERDKIKDSQGIIKRINWVRLTMWRLYYQLVAIREGRSIINKQTDVNAVIKEIVEDLKEGNDHIATLLSSGKVKVTLALQNDLTKIITESEFFKRTLRNIIENAIQASVAKDLETGEYVGIREAIQPEVIIRTHSDEQFLDLQVIDNGVGIRDLDNLRMHFSASDYRFPIQGREAAIDFGDKTGKGFPAFELFINEMEGAVVVDSNPEKGTTVHAQISNKVFSAAPKTGELKLVQAALPHTNGNGGQPSSASVVENSEWKRGGIDLNKSYLKLERQGKASDFKININSDTPRLKINGLMPRVDRITPIPNIFQLLGYKEENPSIKVSLN